MASAIELQRFFRKRGFKVHKVTAGYDGYVVFINRPEAAKALFDSSADTTHLLFVPHKRWWEKLLFWRK